MDTYLYHLTKAKELFSLYRKNNESKETLLYLDVVEGEFIKYYFFNCHNNIFKFIFRFIFQFFQQPFFELIFVNNHVKGSLGKLVTYLNTSDYIFNDNISPLMSELEKRGISSSSLSLKKYSIYSLKNRFGKFKFSLFTVLSEKLILSSPHNFVLTLYLYLIVVPNLIRLLGSIDKEKRKIGTIIISPDPCDIFSRSLFFFSQKNSLKYYLLQIGPTQSDALEWESIQCDIVFSWKESEKFFSKNYKNFISFFPPRFFYSLSFISDHNKEFDIVVFLPWVLKNDEGFSILKMIEKSIFVLLKLNRKVSIKYHPAGKINLDLNFKNIEILDSSLSNIQIIGKARKVINYGSTLSYDCNFLNVSCAIVNINSHIPIDSPFLTLSNVSVINNYEDLEHFVNIPILESDYKVSGDFEIVNYIYNSIFEP
jgi:hypothetical protein